VVEGIIAIQVAELGVDRVGIRLPRRKILDAVLDEASVVVRSHSQDGQAGSGMGIGPLGGASAVMGHRVQLRSMMRLLHLMG
jgi:hypothetical protein